jgi:hypothetical protein
MKLSLKLAGMALASVVLAGCGGGGNDSPALAATADAALPASSSTAGAVANTSFAFASGVSELGTVAPTTLMFTNTATTPAFSITSGGNTATGTTSFGSCDFKVTASTFPAGSRLSVGQTVIVNPCTLKVGTAGVAANGVAATRSVALLLGASASAGASVTLSVNAGGQLTLNGTSVGTVTLAPVTGS